MSFNLKVSFIVLLFAVIAYNVSGQVKDIDSLKSSIKKAQDDTNKVNSLLLLSKKYFSEEPGEAIRIATQARNLAEKIKFKRGEAYALKNIGIGYYMQGKYLETFENWNKSMKCFDALGDKQGRANILNNIGTVYFRSR